MCKTSYGDAISSMDNVILKTESGMHMKYGDSVMKNQEEKVKEGTKGILENKDSSSDEAQKSSQ